MYCFACRKRVNGSAHIFPSNPECRSKWLTALGVVEIDIRKKSSLCDKHFEESCFKKDGKKIRLMKGSVPTLCIDKREIRRKLYFDSDISSEEENDSIDVSESTQVMELDRVVKIDNRVGKLEIYAENGSSVKINDISKLRQIQQQSEDSGKESLVNYENGKMSLADHSYCGNLDNHDVGNRLDDLSNCIQSKPPPATTSHNRQNMRNPLRLSHVERDSNFATPNPTRKQYNMAKDEIRRLKNKVKMLYQTVSRLNNKLTNLQLLLQEK